MDFSKLLSKEINKKKKKAHATGTTKIAKAKKVKKQKQDNAADTTPVQVVRPQLSSSPAPPPTPPRTEDQIPKSEVIQGNSTPIDEPSEADQAEDVIPEDQLDVKLSQFGPIDESLSKEQKVKQLRIYLLHESKNSKYKAWLDMEAPLYQDPTKQLISLDLITHMQKHKDELYLKLRVYIKELINTWQQDLDKREDEQELALLHETKRDLVRLLYKLRTHKLNDDMLTSLTTIVYYLQQKDYRKANESYMKLSIGNVAWPIGVLNVGIHARSAALRITGEKKAANIMIDEKTRRWITSIKRLITVLERIHIASL